MTRRPAFWFIVAAALFGAGAAAEFARFLNLDSAWYLYAAGAVRRGARLYRDVADVNPPLIIWLSWPPLWIADLFRIAQITAFNLYVITGAGLCLLACVRILPRAWPGSSVEERGLLVAALAFCLMPFVKGDFGQREHLMMILALPYFLLAAVPDSNRPPRKILLLTGAAAGLGFAIKPHFFIGWGLLELYLFARGKFAPRSLARPELVAAATMVAGYVIVLAVFVPQYFGILNDVRRMYGGLDSPISSLVRLPDLAMWIAAATLMISVRLAPAVQRTVTVLFVLTTGFLVTALMQFKGWGYHMYPSRVLMILYFVAFALGMLQSAPALIAMLRGGLRNVSLVIAAGLLATSIRYFEEARHPIAPDLVTPLVAVINEQAPGGAVAMLSMRGHMYPAFPAVNETGAIWSLRFPMLWYLPALYERELELPDAERRFRAPQAMPDVERRYFDGVVDDLCAVPPAVLIVEPPIPRAPPGRRSLDLVAYFSQDPRFARLFRAYAPVTWLGSFTIYGVSRAAGAPAPSCQ